MNKVSRPAPAELTTAIWHIGWGGVDLPNEFNWWKAKGVEFHKPITKLGETNYYMYLYGPDREVVEIYSGEQNHRYNHVHLFATDVNATSQWYADHLGIPLRRRDIPKPSDPTARWANAFRVDNVTINVFAKPDTDPPPSWWSDKPLKTLEPTRGRVIDHIAFSYRRIEPVFERMKKAGIQIVEPIAVREDSGLKSFFVLGPDNVLIEIVEARPIPDASWDK
jgi:catechol 2,3-dioxygenase-like lactoylglutathione lyase family enzyme